MSATSILYHHPESVDSGVEKRIVIPVRYQGYVQVLLWVWLAIWGAAEALFVLSLVGVLPFLSPATSTGVRIAMLALFSVAGAFLLWHLAWVSTGRETIDITADRLIVRRGPLGGPPEKYDRTRIRNLRVGSYAGRLVYPSWGRHFVGKEECFVAFDEDGKARAFGRGLRRRDAEYVVALLREP